MFFVLSFERAPVPTPLDQDLVLRKHVVKLCTGGTAPRCYTTLRA
jgi:hypothetical protein